METATLPREPRNTTNEITHAARPRVFAGVTDEGRRTADLRRQVLSYRAERPRSSAVASAVNDALRFIDLLPATATLPFVALADDGEVNFNWRHGNSLFIDVGFVGDGVMHYYVSEEASGLDVDASIPFSGRSLPPDIARAMPLLGGQD